MPALKTYNIFISPAWRYGEAHDRLIKLLDDAPDFNYRNYSSPKAESLFPSYTSIFDDTIKSKIASKIRLVNCVLVISGMYAQYRNMMLVDIEIALELDKPIIGIRPFDGQQMPRAVFNATDLTVGWKTASIVGAIRKYSV